MSNVERFSSRYMSKNECPNDYNDVRSHIFAQTDLSSILVFPEKIGTTFPFQRVIQKMVTSLKSLHGHIMQGSILEVTWP